MLLLPLCGDCHNKVHNKDGELEGLSKKLGSGEQPIIPSKSDMVPVFDLGTDDAQSFTYQNLLRYGSGLSVSLPPEILQRFSLKPKDEVVIQTEAGAPNEIRLFLPTARSEDGFECDDTSIGGWMHQGSSRPIHSNGQVTIPEKLREKHGIESGDSVIIGENPEGDLCIVKP